MATDRHLTAVPDRDNAETPGEVPAEEVLRLNVEDLDRANRRARTIRKGGKADELLYDIRTAERHLGAATDHWNLHDLRHSRLTHAGEDGATEADLMNLSGHEDRRTLQRYLKPSKEGIHRRLDGLDARGTWTPNAAELTARMTSNRDSSQTRSLLVSHISPIFGEYYGDPIPAATDRHDTQHGEGSA
ncbi:site-specific integrase [Nonomuraea terrae]|uniref:Site-specific integrase n=1 Tax=Nonomuraea terrae TaxID=2530383 RepID=A0A4R4Z4A3_9ACTN|nr:tyrosine-type recombinase/integrase [Nonomuraea terrae]TDD52951.1 site-specific integrase [Nonomuraea terrae]